MEESSFLGRFKDFRNGPISYPGQLEKYQNILFRQFAGEKDVISHLAQSLSEELEDTETISRLISQIETKNIPLYFTASHIAQTLKRQLTYYVRMKPFATSYYCEELDLVKPFIRGLDRFHEKTQQKLLDKLRKPHAFNVTEMETILKNIERFLIQMNTYYQELKPFTEYESGSGGVVINTYTEQYITQIVSLIEKFISEIKSTQSLLKSLKIKLTRRETNMLYN